MRHRPEIDGLRAVAVLPVILFHADIPGFAGGFVGVDVFFVISGFLITSIIAADVEAGTFSILRFYERRARRILPALLFVAAACLPAAWLLMLPYQMKEFSGSVVASSSFVSNIFFWANSGYFAGPNAERPLLHTWSLAVEEQFYLVFPLVFAALLRRQGSRKSVQILTIVAVVSLIACSVAVQRAPDAAFYLTPFRVWELLAGSVCAMIAGTSGGRRRRAWMSLLGLLAILVSIFAYDSGLPYPGLYTLVPVTGTCLVLLFADLQTFTGRILSWRLLTGIGLISYSAYLWHQPVLSFTRLAMQDSPSLTVLWACVALSIALAVFSWRFVETPFRRAPPRTEAPVRVLAYSIGALITFIGIGSVGLATDGFAARRSLVETQILAWRKYDLVSAYRLGSCFLSENAEPGGFAPDCEGGGDVALWGDSHVAALWSGWRHFDSSVSEFASAGCPPYLGVEITGRPYCRAANEAAFARVTARRRSAVILYGNWSRDYAAPLAGELKTTLKRLRDAHQTNVIVLGGTPHFKPPVPQQLVKQKAQLDRPLMLDASVDEVAAVDGILRDVAQSEGATFISLLDLLCEHSTCPAVVATERGGFDPMMWDYGHMTESGAVFLIRALLSEQPPIRAVVPEPVTTGDRAIRVGTARHLAVTK